MLRLQKQLRFFSQWSEKGEDQIQRLFWFSSSPSVFNRCLKILTSFQTFPWEWLHVKNLFCFRSRWPWKKAKSFPEWAFSSNFLLLHTQFFYFISSTSLEAVSPWDTCPVWKCMVSFAGNPTTYTSSHWREECWEPRSSEWSGSSLPDKHWLMTRTPLTSSSASLALIVQR